MNILKKYKIYFFFIFKKKNNTFYFFLLTKKKIPCGISTWEKKFQEKNTLGVKKVMHRYGDRSLNLYL